ncbi:MAG: YfgM family protein [Burkholderiales bacterium]
MAMQNLDLEEQEQLESLKAWWKQNARLILFAIVAAGVALAGMQGWRWYQNSQAQEASRVYDVLAKAVRAGDAKAVRDAGGALAEHYGSTLYASLGALEAARFHFDRGELRSAAAQLQWVIDRSGSEDLHELARLRLASVLLDEKSYDEALKALEPKPRQAYATQFAALRGDILAAQKRVPEARAAYREALEKAEGSFRDSVQMRLDGLGS